MTIEARLKSLVSRYAKYDPIKKSYVAQLDAEAIKRLGENLSTLIDQQLQFDESKKEGLVGTEKGELVVNAKKEESKLTLNQRITKNYKNLSLLFHPDHHHDFLPEVQWLEQNLSKGACFRSLSLCYEKLITPEKFKENSFGVIRSKEDCKRWLESLKEKATTYTGRSLCDSLINLLDQSSGFFDEVGQIKPTGMRVLLRSIPMIFATYGAVIFAEELLAIYALYFVILKGGQLIGSSNSTELQRLGHTLQEIGYITATATTTLIVRLLEMTFWASRQCLDVSLQIGHAILNPLLPIAPQSKEADITAVSNLCRDLVLSSQSTLKLERRFITPELNFIVAPLKNYLDLNSQQFFRDWRLGKDKSLLVNAFIFKMRLLDGGTEPIEVKLLEAKKELEKIKENSSVYNKNTAQAVDQAFNVIEMLELKNDSVPLLEPDHSDMQLVVYQKRM